MKIPKTIQIAGKNIIIKFDDDHCDRNGGYGIAEYFKGEIVLQRKVKGDIKRPDHFVEETFIHEILHYIAEDEKLVGQLSELLYQVIKQIEDKNNV